MMPPLRSFDDVNGKERGQKKTDDLRAMTTLGPRTLDKIYCSMYYIDSNILTAELINKNTLICRSAGSSL